MDHTVATTAEAISLEIIALLGEVVNDDELYDLTERLRAFRAEGSIDLDVWPAVGSLGGVLA